MLVKVDTIDILSKSTETYVYSPKDNNYFKLKNSNEALFYIDKSKRENELEGSLVRDSEGYKFRVKDYSPFSEGELNKLNNILNEKE